MGKNGYDRKGLYNAYDRNNKERAALDYYATPTKEVENILHRLNINFTGQHILEPCVGGGHMMEGILNYIKDNDFDFYAIYGTDIQNRGYNNSEVFLKYGLEYDFFSDDYPYPNMDYVIMNPPYSVIEPFCIRALEIAQKGCLMLGRLQFLEGANRYKNIFENCPPTDIFVYVDRIQCWRNGVEPKGSSAQAYAWFYWDKSKPDSGTQVHWIHRA